MGATEAEVRNDDVDVYRVGLLHMSVCVPAGMAVDDILDRVNVSHPTGLGNGWMLDTAETFSGGQPNPCPCEATTGRLHRLLVC